MKKNNKTYLLLAVVIAVWGIIGYKLINAANPLTNEITMVTSNEVFVPKKVKERDTFSIAADYRDPFLGTVYAPKKKNKTTVKKTIKTAPVPQKNISYTGFITDKASDQKIFFVTIEGQQHMMALNQTVQEVKLVSGSKGKIKVRSDGNLSTIILAK